MKSVKNSLPCRVLSDKQSTSFLGSVSVVPVDKVRCISAPHSCFSHSPRCKSCCFTSVLAYLLTGSLSSFTCWGRSNPSCKDKLDLLCSGQDKVTISSGLSCPPGLWPQVLQGSSVDIPFLPLPPVMLWQPVHWLWLTTVTLIFVTHRWRDCSSAIQMLLVLMRRQCG